MRDAEAPITVITPCLNAEQTLCAAIQSALHQTAEPMELIVVDDGSTDRSVAVAASFDARVRVLRNPGRGPNAARQFGVTQARGKYVTFVDADDTIVRSSSSVEGLTISSALFSDFLMYRPNGRVMRATVGQNSGSFTSCDYRGAEHAKAIVLDLSGRPRVIGGYADGMALSCT